MGHRLSKITTRTGDAGETGLGDGSRVSKSSLRVRALGDLDELNSAIGLVLAEDPPAEVSEAARRYLNRLSDLLFIAGRRLNRHAGRTDVQWRHERKKR